MQVINKETSNKYYKEKNWINGFRYEHWYFLEREFNKRFEDKRKDELNILRLNKYLGLPPFNNTSFIAVGDKCKLSDTTYKHECYVFADYLLTCRKYDETTDFKAIYNPFNRDLYDKFIKKFKFNWDNKEFKDFIKEKTKNLNFKCFCTFLIKKFEFNKKIDDLFKNYDKKKDIKTFIEELNKTLEMNDIISDFIYHTIPWSGKGRTFDYGSNKSGELNKNGISEFMIPEGEYLNTKKFTPIFLNKKIISGESFVENTILKNT